MPPRPKRIPHELKVHGDVRIDDYYWVNNREDPDVLELLRLENEYFDLMTSHLAELKEAIYNEILERIVQDERSLPVLKGSYAYSTLMRKGMSYPIHTRRKKDSPGALELSDPTAQPPNDEEVIVDQNVEAQGHDYFSLGGIEISPSEELAAVLFDYEGNEIYTLKVKNIKANTYLSDEIEEVSTSMAWSKDCKYIFYTKLDAAMRPFELWQHEIGSKASQDQLIYREDDEAFFLSISTTKDDSWLLLELNSKISSEIRVLRTDEPSSVWTLIEKRHEDFEYHIDHIEMGGIGYFLVLTNHDALNFKLCLAPCDQPSLEHWVDLIEYDPSIRTEDLEVFKNFVVVSQRKDAAKRLLVIDLNNKKQRVIESNQSVGVVSPTGNADIGLDFIRYKMETLNRPEAIFDEKLDGSSPPELRFQRPVKNIDLDKFASYRLFATSEDGTKIPISLIEPINASMSNRQSRPLVLYAYGAYEISIDPWFSPARYSLLERGGIFAIAHVRGGGEMGRSWYEEGKFEKKSNTFKDLVTVSKYLIDNGYTSPDQLVIRGGSAGGLTVGAAANLAPDLFKGVVAEVPFVDVLTTMSDPSLPLTVIEWDEWGNPIENENIYFEMKAYSPYDNVKKDVKYPAIFATGGWSDPRVGYFEPTKWVQKLRNSHDENIAILRMELSAGHGGASGRYRQWEDEAQVLAWIIDITKA